MKSELFNGSYCIFIDRDSSIFYKNELEKESLLEEGVRVLNATFDSSLSCIVIPSQSDHKKIIDKLWEKRIGNGGFWSQYGMGYSGKEWELA